MAKKLEQSIWSVRINSQLLYKKAVNGRTVLLGMTAEESKKVGEVLDKAIEEIAKILEKRTTRHEAPKKKKQVTTVDTSIPETATESEEVTKTSKKPKIKRGADGKFISKSAPKSDNVKKKPKKQTIKPKDAQKEISTDKKDGGWGILGKLRA